MGIIEQSIRVWEDGERIKAYCARNNYSIEDCAALCQLHRLQLGQDAGTLGGTVLDALESIANSSDEAKAVYRKIGNGNPEMSEALFRLAEDKNYTAKIIGLYNLMKTEVSWLRPR